MTDSPAAPLRAALTDTRVLAILRARTATHLLPAARALAENGITAVEFTLTTEGALDALRTLRRESPELLAGAGTVVEPRDAEAAVDAGAQFLVAPCVRTDTLETARRLGVPMLAGALTPSEVVTAVQHGCELVKLFPSSLGPGYVKALRDPLPDVELVVTGGVALDAIPAFLDAGAFAVGLGSPLTGDSLVTGDLGGLADRARTALAAAQR